MWAPGGQSKPTAQRNDERKGRDAQDALSSRAQMPAAGCERWEGPGVNAELARV